MATIKASRNGETREFYLELWKNMPDDKYGWKAAAEVPEEVKGLQQTMTGNPGEGVQLNNDLPPAVTNPLPAAEVPEEVKGEEVKADVKQTKATKNAEAKK